MTNYKKREELTKILFNTLDDVSVYVDTHKKELMPAFTEKDILAPAKLDEFLDKIILEAKNDQKA